MKQLADGVWQLSGFPADNINKYLVGDVLIDAGAALDGKRILRDLEGRDVAAHALTHAHFDHYGSSHARVRAAGRPAVVRRRRRGGRRGRQDGGPRRAAACPPRRPTGWTAR